MLNKFRVGAQSVILLISCETILLKAHASRGIFLGVSIHNSGHTVSDPMIFTEITLFACTSIWDGFWFKLYKETHYYSLTFPPINYSFSCK